MGKRINARIVSMSPELFIPQRPDSRASSRPSTSASVRPGSSLKITIEPWENAGSPVADGPRSRITSPAGWKSPIADPAARTRRSTQPRNDGEFRRMSVKTAAYQDRSRTRTVGSPIAFYEVGGGGATRSPGAVAPYDQYFSGTSTASSDVWSIPPLRAAPVVTPSYHKNEFEQRSITLLERRGQERATRLLGFGTDFQKRNDSLERGDASPRRVDVVGFGSSTKTVFKHHKSDTPSDEEVRNPTP
ncbi:hypothetical protein T484DRAFT_3222047 [Baffinella frigidus]|nr:hypothetical protein T484DRAFT_3222047 [Cryptophyta sp. CCMP2293]